MIMCENGRWPCCQGNFQVPPTTVFVGGLGWQKCCHGWGVHFHRWQRLYCGMQRGGARHLYDAPEKMISWSSCWQKCIQCYYCPVWEQVCLCLQILVPCVRCVCICYLSWGPSGTLTDIWHTKAETVSATEWIIFLQVVETWFTQITVGSHYVLLRTQEQVTYQTKWDFRQQVRLPDSACGQVTLVQYVQSDDATVFTLQMQALQGSVLMLPDRLHSQRTHSGKSLYPNAQRSHCRPVKPSLHLHWPADTPAHKT